MAGIENKIAILNIVNKLSAYVPLALSPELSLTMLAFSNTEINSARRTRRTHQRPAHKASPELLVDPTPTPHLHALPSYNLADTLTPTPPPFEGAQKRKPFYHHAGSSAESLSLSVSSPHRPPPPFIKHKRRPPPPISSGAPNSIPKSTLATNHKDALPLQVDPILTSRSSTSFLAQKSVSSPLLFDLHTSAKVPILPPPYSPPYTKLPSQLPEHAASPSPQLHPHAPSPYTIPHPHMNSDTEDDNESSMIYTSRLGSSSIMPSGSSSNVHNNNSHAYTRASPSSSSAQSLRSRIFSLASSSTHASSSSRIRDKPICTTPGVLCAGETETETDEPSRALPTARIIPPSLPLIPPTTLEQRLTPLLFEFARLLSIVPAVFGTLYNLYFLVWPPQARQVGMGVGRPPPERVDYFISALWAILTGYQCLALATGLLARWRLYYPPLSTLVRLLALQGICWPATHLTLTVLQHEVRPVVTWAVIGTTTCCSRSVQIWRQRQAYWRRWRSSSKWNGRRWDWGECALPAGVVYFVMAWAEQLRRELATGTGAGGAS
ncbi:hypothetical protein CVT25_009512 [Psilocybe cyanescens]|uniref:N-glycosylation protein EOS1 n=1 Tax=Psilocybe cyanescens TaxID=93625 RepID=A0A409X887_PSICY|nr:hypothetical protein CVT25_009512 [Psilocybe cyanescens]